MPKAAKAAKPGPLHEPIVRTDPLALALMARGKGDAEARKIYDDESNRILRLQFDKLILLFHHYKIDVESPRRWMWLAFALAHDHVPGMRVVETPPRGRGRPPKWKAYDGRILLLDVNEILRERRKGVSDAVRVATKRHPRWSEYQAPGKARVLEARYYEVRSAEKGHAGLLGRLYSLATLRPIDEKC